MPIPRLAAMLTVLLLAILLPNTVTAQDIGQGPGIQLRAGHIEGQGIIQYRSITPVELFPYYLMDDSLIYADLRFFPTNSLELGGNVGLGYRYFSQPLDRIFGASVWYDGDDTRGLYFQQTGLSLETMAGPFDVRTNFYLPIGDVTQTTSLNAIAGSTRFDGDHVAYDQARSWFAAMKGLDAEVGVPIPGSFAVERNIRIFGGGYHFVGENVDSITGASARLQGNVVSGLDAQVQVTYDDFYQTRGFVGVSWTFGALHRMAESESTTYSRIGEHVNRNYTVVAPGRHTIEHVLALNPATGTPYTFAHVSNAAVSATAAGGLGSVDNPFQTIAEAQAAGRDVIFVQSGSVFDGADASIVLANGQRLLGDGSGVQHALATGQGTLILPHGPGSGARPILKGAPGDSVTLASNTEFAGFQINNTGANALFANGAQNVSLRNLRIDGASLDGLRFYNASGGITINDLVVANSGRGINIQGGQGLFDFTGPTTVSNATGSAVLIKNLSSDASVQFSDLTVDHRQARGMEIDNAQGNVTVTGTANISNESNSTSSALEIKNSTGAFSYNSLVASNTTGAAGVLFQYNTGVTQIDSLNLTSHNGTALFADHVGGLLINGSYADGSVDMSKYTSIDAVNGTALDARNTGLNVNLTSLSSTNAVRGLSLTDTTGAFAVNGGGAAGTGGTIRNAVTGVYLQNTGATALQWMNFNANGTAIRADNVSYLLVPHSTITNSTAFGIDALNTTALTVFSSTLTDNGAANVRGQFSQVRSYAYNLTDSAFTSSTGDNVVLTSLAGSAGSTMNLTVSGSGFENTSGGSTGLKANWNGLLVGAVQNTAFYEAGGTNTGVYINNASTTASSTLSVTGSQFLVAGSSSKAVQLVAAGPSTINLSKNQVNFNAVNGTGFKLALAGSSTTSIIENDIIDATDGATGILFDSIVVPARVTIEDNLISLANTGGLLDRGIIFTSVTPTATDFLQLSGSKNNIIQQADTPFFVPGGTTTGGIFINGTRLP